MGDDRALGAARGRREGSRKRTERQVNLMPARQLNLWDEQRRSEPGEANEVYPQSGWQRLEEHPEGYQYSDGAIVLGDVRDPVTGLVYPWLGEMRTYPEWPRRDIVRNYTSWENLEDWQMELRWLAIPQQLAITPRGRTAVLCCICGKTHRSEKMPFAFCNKCDMGNDTVEAYAYDLPEHHGVCCDTWWIRAARGKRAIYTKEQKAALKAIEEFERTGCDRVELGEAHAP